jgi:adenylate cyclase
MNRHQPKNRLSVTGRILSALVLMGVLPCLLLVFLFFHETSGPGRLFFWTMPLVLVCMVSGYGLLHRLAGQIRDLKEKTGQLSRGGKTVVTDLCADAELAEIAGHFHSLQQQAAELNQKNQQQATQLMVYARDLALSYQRSKREEQLRNRLSRYVGTNLVEKLINLKDGVFLETERRNVTVLFADIRSFTTIAERMAAEEVVGMLNEYFSVMVDIIFKNSGLLDKFVGDQLIAVFGLVENEGNAPANAIRTAIEIQAVTDAMRRRRMAAGLEYFELGIGINTGTGIIGNIGSANRMDYTVIGDCVNVAARLEQMARGGEIIIGEQTHLANTENFAFECRGRVHVKNKLEPVVCYHVLRS